MADATTPGQAACEAFDKLVFTEGTPERPYWDRIGEEHRAAWEAAAQAAIAAHQGTLPRLHALLAARRERDEARKVAAEMLAHWEYIGTTRDDDRLINGDDDAPGWRQRAGLGPS